MTCARPGQYDNIVWHGDCIAGMAALPGGSADIVIADPPYNIGKDFGNNRDSLPLPDYLVWSRRWLDEALRVMKPSATMFIYGFAEILAHISVFFPPDRQRWLVWHYTNKNVPSLHFWQRSHESILCVWQKRPIFNRDSVREPYSPQFLAACAGRSRPSTCGRYSRHGSPATIYNAHANGALPRDVINIPTLAGGAALRERGIYCQTCQKLVPPGQRKEHRQHKLVIHPTQKPLRLTRRLLASCKPAEKFNVLVPFAGSGSECRCAVELGGRFAAFELNADYARLANETVAEFLRLRA